MKITIKNLQNKIPINPKRIKKAILKVLSSENIKKSGEITVCFVNDKKIRELNLKYRNINSLTDVMAFNISGEGASNILADIVISTDRAIANARVFKTSSLYELYLYVVHAVLHILGYDDKSKKDKIIMQKKEETLCQSTRPKP